MDLDRLEMESEQLDKLSRLKELLQYNIRVGSFELSSGDQSDYYCDAKSVAMSPEGSYLIGDLLCDIIFKYNAEAIGGLAMGAAYISSAVSLTSHIRNRPLYNFVIRKKWKQHGMEQSADYSLCTSGRVLRPYRNIVIVDDVITTGSSIVQVLNYIAKFRCHVLAVIALVDRSKEDIFSQAKFDYKYLFRMNGKVLEFNDGLF